MSMSFSVDIIHLINSYKELRMVNKTYTQHPNLSAGRWFKPHAWISSMNRPRNNAWHFKKKEKKKIVIRIIKLPCFFYIRRKSCNSYNFSIFHHPAWKKVENVTLLRHPLIPLSQKIHKYQEYVLKRQQTILATAYIWVT